MPPFILQKDHFLSPRSQAVEKRILLSIPCQIEPLFFLKFVQLLAGRLSLSPVATSLDMIARLRYSCKQTKKLNWKWLYSHYTAFSPASCRTPRLATICSVHVALKHPDAVTIIHRFFQSPEPNVNLFNHLAGFKKTSAAIIGTSVMDVCGWPRKARTRPTINKVLLSQVFLAIC